MENLESTEKHTLKCPVHACPKPIVNGYIDKIRDKEYETICENEYYKHIKVGRKSYLYKRHCDEGMF